MKTINQIQKKKIKITSHFLMQDDSSMRCLLFAALGFSNRYIRDATGLNDAEIQQRVSKVGIKRKMYRDGTSSIAKRVLSQTDRYVEKALQDRLRKQPLISAKNLITINL